MVKRLHCKEVGAVVRLVVVDLVESRLIHPCKFATTTSANNVHFA